LPHFCCTNITMKMTMIAMKILLRCCFECLLSIPLQLLVFSFPIPIIMAISSSYPQSMYIHVLILENSSSSGKLDQKWIDLIYLKSCCCCLCCFCRHSKVVCLEWIVFHLESFKIAAALKQKKETWIHSHRVLHSLREDANLDAAAVVSFPLSFELAIHISCMLDD